MIIAGEASGDLHGGRLVQALLHENPTLDIFGVGGDHMAAAGMKLYYHINEFDQDYERIEKCYQQEEQFA